MKSLAMPLVIATQFVATRTREHTEDDDVSALVEVAFIFRAATPNERRDLPAAAEEMGLSTWADDMGVEE